MKQIYDNFVNAKEYKTTIIPTFDCNYHCWYCIQKHSSTVISKQQLSRIVRHVKKYLKEHDINSYILSWFGGEPLMQPDVINQISTELKLYCTENHIEFSGAITTNGSLLNTANILMLKKNDINFYQIAVDGDEKTHNKTKKEKNGVSSFKRIISNIVSLLTLNENASVTLRINYTVRILEQNSIVEDLNRIIPPDKRKNINVDLQKVWQENEFNVSIDKLVILMKQLVSSGYRLNSDHVFSICYVNKLHFNTIYYTGGVDKCDKHGINELRGKINGNGDIEWNETPLINQYSPFDLSAPCGKCKYFPVCYCCCPVTREERIKKFGKIICGYEGKFELFKHRIQDYCWRRILNEEIK